MPIPNELRPFAETFGLADSETLAEIFGFLYDHEDDMALIPALPGTVKEISLKTKIPEIRVKEELNRLARKGGIMKTGPGQYALPDVLLLLRDCSIQWSEAPEAFFIAWQKIYDNELTKALAKQRETGVGHKSRTFVIEETVHANSKVIEHDSLRQIIRSMDPIAVIPCPCRLQHSKAGKRSKDCPAGDKSFCLSLGGMAQSIIKSGQGKAVSKEEALEIIDDAARAGLVHNTTELPGSMAICNCCPCCCILLHTVAKGFPELLEKSGFLPVLDQEACTGCGSCKDRCSFSAIQLDEYPTFDTGKCYGCGSCASVCQVKAITMKKK